jgi:hypothetical protein
MGGWDVGSAKKAIKNNPAQIRHPPDRFGSRDVFANLGCDRDRDRSFTKFPKYS